MATQADYTHQILLGLDAKAKMKLTRTTAKARARAEFETQIKAREKDLFAEAEAEFAGTIKKLHDSGVPGVVIRKDILGTNDWATWTRWRDLAGVEPETRVLERLRVEAVSNQKPYRIEDEMVIVTRDEDGPIEEFPLTGVGKAADGESYVFWPPLTPGWEGWESYKESFGDVNTLTRFLNKAFAEYGETPETY